ncbi:hypothetical protein [Cyclobacterium xiamenense]|uniref:hypothetical protein n=1 Tax=Cyclobacterium xiamenense TaxID=1297121 RepID=UPI0012B9D435|nr:hypothetical protein [Cyclobacterium xiamenense]
MKKYQINWDKKSDKQPLKQLSERMHEFTYRDRPLIPVYARNKPKRFQDRTANELTQAIIQFFRLQGGIAERINSMGRQVDNTKTYTDPITGARRSIGSVEWVRGTSTEGTADISATVFGLSVKVEVKIGNDRQSDAQKQYQKRIEQAGGIYIIARSFDGFLHEFFRAIDQLM